MIVLTEIKKGFPTQDSSGAIPVIDDISLEVPEGKITALFGPNGCGKTTILNIVAGVDTPDSGEVSLNPNGNNNHKIGYVFQNFRDILLPWESALLNVSFGLRARGVPRSIAINKSREFIEKHRLKIPENNYSYQLSIGQQQTVILARTLVQHPQILLLDEPFAALDHDARFRMHDIVFEVIRQAKSTTLFVSHDMDEALFMSDEVILLSKRPARVINRFPVPFEHPRRHDLIVSEEFSKVRRNLMSAFVEEVGI